MTDSINVKAQTRKNLQVNWISEDKKEHITQAGDTWYSGHVLGTGCGWTPWPGETSGNEALGAASDYASSTETPLLSFSHKSQWKPGGGFLQSDPATSGVRHQLVIHFFFFKLTSNRDMLNRLEFFPGCSVVNTRPMWNQSFNVQHVHRAKMQMSGRKSTTQTWVQDLPLHASVKFYCLGVFSLTFFLRKKLGHKFLLWITDHLLLSGRLQQIIKSMVRPSWVEKWPSDHCISIFGNTWPQMTRISLNDI